MQGRPRLRRGGTGARSSRRRSSAVIREPAEELEGMGQVDVAPGKDDTDASARHGRPWPCMAAARARTPVGSTTSFMRSHTNRMARMRSSSETVTMSSTFSRTRGKVSFPSDGVRAPSAMVCGLWDGLEDAGLERARGVVAGLGLHAHHAAARAELSSREGASGEEATSAAAHEQQLEVPRLLEKLLAHCPLPGNDVDVVVRRDQDERCSSSCSRAATSSRLSVAGS